MMIIRSRDSFTATDAWKGSFDLISQAREAAGQTPFYSLGK